MSEIGSCRGGFCDLRHPNKYRTVADMGHLENSTSGAIYAHTLPLPKTQADWELLTVHAAAVASLARQFAEAFHAGDWGELLGRWHDLGKVQPEFQEYIRGERASGPPHAWVGALFALLQDQKMGLPIAAAIAAHHGALPNIKPDAANGCPPGTTLLDSVARWKIDLPKVKPFFPPPIALPAFPPHAANAGADLSKIELFTRFLFSALIDADRTATAAFYSLHKPAITHADVQHDDIATLAERLDRAVDAMPAKGSPAVIVLRRQVLTACRLAAGRSPGRFSLTVPTGGGKTLSAMSFALNHAKRHKLCRVIVVIPYTSIIEQSASVYSDILDSPGKLNVLEHHSNIDEQSRFESDSRGENHRRLAAENWKAPIVVTTTVQFFESLLAAHGSRCRKVHNIARSVILLDEVQTLPREFFETIVNLLTQLTDGYGCSVLLSTATPPALAVRPRSPSVGLTNVHEIMPDPSRLAVAAKRVNIQWRINIPTPYTELAKELRAHQQVLAIVHRRNDARVLAEAINDESVLHLSAAMCPAHRLTVLEEVRHRLTTRQPCRLISTQLIEAGVDVDFPVVYRSLAGLDSIAQSAGRCDREGKLTELAGAPAGQMIVYQAETPPPPGTLRKALQSMQVLLKTRPVDPFEPAHSLDFFDELYNKIGPDERRIQPLRQALAFEAIAERFKLIDGDTCSVVVAYSHKDGHDPKRTIDGRARIAAWKALPNRETSRGLQPLIVQVRRYQRDALRAAGVIAPAGEFDQFDFICEGRETAYDQRFGLENSTSPVAAAEDFVV